MGMRTSSRLILAMAAALLALGCAQQPPSAARPPSPAPASPSPAATAATQPASRQVTAGQTSGVFHQYTITVPNSWTDDRPGAGTLQLSAGAYSMTVSQQAGGAGPCLYPGDPPQDMFAQQFSSYVEISAGTYGRGPNSGMSGTYTVCQKHPETYHFPTNAGYITYPTPASPDPSRLAEMDAMVASIVD